MWVPGDSGDQLKGFKVGSFYPFSLPFFRLTRNLFERTMSLTRGIDAISDHSSGRSMLVSRMQSIAKKREDCGKLVNLQSLASFTPLPTCLPLQRAGVQEVVEACEEARFGLRLEMDGGLSVT